MSQLVVDDKNSNKVTTERPSKPKADPVLRWACYLGLLMFILSLYELHIDFAKLWNGTAKFVQLTALMFPPDMSQWKYVMVAALQSLQVAIVGTAIGILIAFFLSFLAAENLTPNRALSTIIKAGAALLRAIPTLVWALIFIVAVGMGPVPGILAISTHAAGMLIKVYAQSLEEVDEGIIEALRATGSGWFGIILQGVLPTSFSSFLAWSALRLENDIGESTILGAVGAGGIGWELSNAMRSYAFDQGFFITIVIFLMVFSIELATNRFKGSIRNKM